MTQTHFNVKVSEFARKFTTVSKDELISQAFWTLESKEDTHLVVVEDNRPTGILSYKDFLRVLMDRARMRRFSRLYVSSIMTTSLITIDANETILNAAKKMLEYGISSLLVTEGENITSIITKKDILRKVKDLPIKDLNVDSIMSKSPITAPMGMTVTRAERLLREKKISTLPIVEEGELVGYIDIHILARFIIGLFLNPEHRHPEKVIRNVTLGDIMKGTFFVLPETSLEEFSMEILRRNFKGAPVVPSSMNKRVIGVVTETDIVKYIAQQS